MYIGPNWSVRTAWTNRNLMKENNGELVLHLCFVLKPLLCRNNLQHYTQSRKVPSLSTTPKFYPFYPRPTQQPLPPLNTPIYNKHARRRKMINIIFFFTT